MGASIKKSKFKGKDALDIVRGDLENIKQIVHFNYDIFKEMYKDEPYSLKQYKEKLKGKYPIIFISKKNNEIAGDSISFRRDNSFYIWILGVAEKHRGQGIGGLLLENNEQFARENGYKSVSIKVYNVSKEMQRLLEQRGYQIARVEKSKADSRYDAILFELKFNV